MKKTARTILVVLIIAFAFSSCAVQKPTYKKGDNIEQYHKKLQKHYEYNKEKHGKFVN